MNKNIFLIFMVFTSITVIPIANAQLSFGEQAYQKSIELIVDETEIIKAKHMIGYSNNPVSIRLFENVIVESIRVINEEGKELEFGITGIGNEGHVTILSTNQNAIVEYNLKNIFYKTISDNTSILDIGYPQTFSILFPEKTELIFLNNNVIQLGDKKGITINGGGYIKIQYYSNTPKMIKEIQWEENKFDVEIITDSKIDKFNFEQTSKSISFQVNEEDKFVTIIMSEELLGGPYLILLNDEKIKFNKTMKDENNVVLNIKPEVSGEIVIIGTTVIPEFSMFIPLIMGFFIILTMPLIKKINLH
jgi:predicted DNA binding CopG/RHH family protein